VEFCFGHVLHEGREWHLRFGALTRHAEIEASPAAAACARREGTADTCARDTGYQPRQARRYKQEGGWTESCLTREIGNASQTALRNAHGITKIFKSRRGGNQDGRAMIVIVTLGARAWALSKAPKFS